MQNLTVLKEDRFSFPFRCRGLALIDSDSFSGITETFTYQHSSIVFTLNDLGHLYGRAITDNVKQQEVNF